MPNPKPEHLFRPIRLRAGEGHKRITRLIRCAGPVLLIALCRWAVAAPEPVLPAQNPPKAEEPKIDLDSILKAIEAISDHPDALKAALQEAIKSADQTLAKQKKEIEALERRLDTLRRVGTLIPGSGAEDKQDAKPQPEPPAAAPAEQSPAKPESPAPAPAEAAPQAASPAPPKVFDDQTRLAFSKRFESEIFPLFKESNGEDNCFKCHGKATMTPLELSEDGGASFQKLLRDRYFDPENKSSLLAKLTSASEHTRMPPVPNKPWDDERISALRRFVNDLYDATRDTAHQPDEQFPAELERPFIASAETKGADESFTGHDNTFLTYYQLQHKIKAVFDDDWDRNEVDLFNENMALFGGADFKRSFNESNKPSATFLAGMDRLAADVVSKAYLDSTGPFENWPAVLRAAPQSEKPNAEFRDAIRRLYMRILLREPEEEEIAKSYAFLRKLMSDPQTEGSGGDETLNFEVTVTGENGVPTTRSMTIIVKGDRRTPFQTAINQRQPAPLGLLRQRVGERFKVRANDSRQNFEISNINTIGNVAFAGIEIVGPFEEGTEPPRRVIQADDPTVRLKGAWRVRDAGKIKVLDDGNENKGGSTAEIPLLVERDGEYEVYARWPGQVKKGNLAESVRVEVAAEGMDHLLLPPAEEAPAAGQARFIVDETIDQIPYRDLKTAFRFDSENDYVEISNAGTGKRVTADAVRFVPLGGGEPILIDNDEADGKENWPIFTEYPFRPYNISGNDCVNDRNARKGEIAIRFTPAKHKDKWKKDVYYTPQVIYPGQIDNETRVPVNVKASGSSPVVQLRYPDHAARGSEVSVDASASYDVQGSKLRYEWRQIGGPMQEIEGLTSPTIRFKVSPAPAHQRAWEGLGRALVNHPDFLFTRPASYYALGEKSAEPETKQRLLLIKIAQDLVSRPPTAEEFEKLESGAPLGDMIDAYLAGGEFEEFYIRRIRLYLESQGTDSQDEPVRLWCYIAFNNRPFQELLTADYTVDKEMKKQDRPAFYGKTGLLTMKGFIEGKPGLPHFNYAAQVAEKFLGYVFEVPPEIVAQREGITAVSTTNPESVCYSCHKVLTPLAFQRMHWDDAGNFRTHDERGLPIDASDQGLVPSYPFRGEGLESFALAAQKKERFVRTIIDTHFNFYFGRAMRWEKEERELYRELWDKTREANYAIKPLIKAIMLSPEYLGQPRPAKGGAQVAASSVP